MAGDSLNDGTQPGSLYLKYGEQEGAEDGNKDRVYLSTTARGTGGNRVDYCQGLGSFVSFSGREHTVNVGIQDDGAVRRKDGGNYGEFACHIVSTSLTHLYSCEYAFFELHHQVSTS